MKRSQCFKGVREFFMEAVQRNGFASRYSSDHLMINDEIAGIGMILFLKKFVEFLAGEYSHFVFVSETKLPNRNRLCQHAPLQNQFMVVHMHVDIICAHIVIVQVNLFVC